MRKAHIYHYIFGGALKWHRKSLALLSFRSTPLRLPLPALGQHGVNIAAFIKEFNARTKDMEGYKIPVVITVYADRSFTFITKTPPTPLLITKAIGLAKGSGVPNKQKVGTITKAQITEIAKTKMPDLNCNTLEAAESQVAGTCRSMGVTVVD